MAGRQQRASRAATVPSPDTSSHTQLVVQLTVNDLEQLLRAVVRDEIEAKTTGRAQAEPMTIPEVAAKCHCSVRTVHRLLADRRLVGHRVGNRIFVSPASVECLIEESTRHR